MVNYCCISGCGRNSRNHKHLNFYGLPKETHRQKKWIKLAGRDDLLDRDMDKLRKTIRFCSRHFSPNAIVNRYLSLDALPTKSLPGSIDEDEPDTPERHNGIICDSCQSSLQGFRYKCVTCDNFDLCQKCEMLERHPQHYMLRIPKSIKFQKANDLVKKWQKLFDREHNLPQSDSNSSDDEPVTKYSRTYDSGIDLTEDVKNDIQNEVDRAIKAVKSQTDLQVVKHVEKKLVQRKESNIQMKESKNNISEELLVEQDNFKQNQAMHELVFADVNEMKIEDVKPSVANLSTANEMPNTNVTDNSQPVLYVTLSNDLSQFMIELADNATGSSVMK